MAQRSKKAWRTVGIVAACIATLLLVRWGVSGSSALTGTADGFSSANGKTLIIHIFADTDPEYLENLKFFVQWGIPPQDQSDYVVVVQSTESATVGLHTAVLSAVAAWGFTGAEVQSHGAMLMKGKTLV